ncbi:integrase, partial [Bifidobacteriaceae bacterium NR016]
THSLRHRYDTKAYESTHDLLLVSKLLGHASVETTQIYISLTFPDSSAITEAVRL